MGIWILIVCLLVACNVNAPGAANDIVSVAVDRDSYVSGDTLVVSILNDTDSVLTTVDHQSFCWIARIERRGPDGWDPADVCPSMEPTQETPVGPGESRVLRLPVALGTEAYPAVLQAGTYRWEFVYSVGARFSFDHELRAVSGVFIVK
jgi:hypothetical protein